MPPPVLTVQMSLCPFVVRPKAMAPFVPGKAACAGGPVVIAPTSGTRVHRILAMRCMALPPRVDGLPRT